MRFDDLRHVGNLNVAIPNTLRIHHHGRSMLAVVQTASLIGADHRIHYRSRQMRFEFPLQVRAPRRVAATARMPLGTLVAADENVLCKLCHGSNCCACRCDFVPKGRQKKRAAQSGPTLTHSRTRAWTQSRSPRLPEGVRGCTLSSCSSAPTPEAAWIECTDRVEA